MAEGEEKGANRGNRSASESSASGGGESKIANRGGTGVARKRQKPSTGALVVGLVGILLFAVLMIGGLSGWWGDHQVTLDPEYYAEAVDYTDLTAEGYEALAAEGKSFVIFIDQEGCTTADDLRVMFTEYIVEKGIRVYNMMFEDVKNSSLYNAVNYYPSVAIVEKGRPVAWLRADEDGDAMLYHDSAELREWLDAHLKVPENA